MKKALSAVLAIITVILMAVPAMAITTSGGTDTTDLTYTVASSFTVTIPVDVAATSAVETTIGNVELTAGALLAFGTTLTVKVAGTNYSGGYRMKDGTNENYLAYTLKNAGIAITDNNVTILTVAAAAANAGASTELKFTPATPTMAGAYADTLTFTVNVA